MSRRLMLAVALMVAAVGGCGSEADESMETGGTDRLMRGLVGEDTATVARAMRDLDAMGTDAIEPLVSAIRESEDPQMRFNALSVLGRIAEDHPEAQAAIDALLDARPELESTAMAMGIRRSAPVEVDPGAAPEGDASLREGETLAQWVQRNAHSVSSVEMPEFDDVPPEAVELKDRGLELAFEENRLADGVKLIEQALAIDPRLPDAYNALFLYHSSGRKDPTTAIAWLTKGVKACPTAGGIHFDLGNAYSEAGRHADAAASFRQAIALGFSNASVWYNLANAFARDGQPADAVPCYRQALVLDPDHDRARRNLIIALHQSNDRAAGLVEARAYLERNPTGEAAAWGREAVRRLSD